MHSALPKQSLTAFLHSDERQHRRSGFCFAETLAAFLRVVGAGMDPSGCLQSDQHLGGARCLPDTFRADLGARAKASCASPAPFPPDSLRPVWPFATDPPP